MARFEKVVLTRYAQEPWNEVGWREGGPASQDVKFEAAGAFPDVRALPCAIVARPISTRSSR